MIRASRRLLALAAPAALVVACAGGGGAASGSGTIAPTATPSGAPSVAVQACAAVTPAPVLTPPPGPSPAPAAGLRVPAGLRIETIAAVNGARELAALPNGDLLVGTTGGSVVLIPFALASTVPSPHTFVAIADAPDAGVAFSPSQCTVYVAAQHGIYAIPYAYGDQTARAAPVKIASVRTGSPPPGSDGDVHSTSSVAYSEVANLLAYAVGSSCNACVETDATRAAVFTATAIGGAQTKRATRVRNAIALATDPASGHLWIGGAGQDSLPGGHPYEFLDDVNAHGGVADYGWPDCEENRIAYAAGAQCGATVAPLVEFPAYSTLIGATFYPSQAGLARGLPSQYRGGIFVTRHGSWHTPGGCNVPPEVDFVPMNGDAPATAVDWNDPTKQWQPFVTGFQPACSASSRIGRPTGIAVGGDGTLFVADDQAGQIYRIRP